MSDDRSQYRTVIDELVHRCQDWPGQVSARRLREGLWNQNADRLSAEMPDQAAMNALLRRLDKEDRELLAGFFAQEFTGGVATALGVLHEQGVVPFDDGYEGTPFHDFAGRMDGWPWPEGN